MYVMYFCGYYIYGKNKEFCVILNVCLKSFWEVYKFWVVEIMIILFYLKKFYVFDIVVCFGNWFCFYYLYDLLIVIVGVYFVYIKNVGIFYLLC